ncbi:CREB-binding protein isoform X2 [Aphelenchoides avenae]|nr:CREB-binding protein isoform X2 [Aphelenchus avenae]
MEPRNIFANIFHLRVQPLFEEVWKHDKAAYFGKNETKSQNGPQETGMTLLDVRQKIECGAYGDPDFSACLVAFRNDMHRVFDTYGMQHMDSYNGHGRAKKFRDFYAETFGDLFREYNFCCAEQRLIRKRLCCTQCVYLIPWGAVYYHLKQPLSDDEFVVCQRCYLIKEVFTLRIDGIGLDIHQTKHDLKKAKHNQVLGEDRVKCRECSLDYHRFCVGWPAADIHNLPYVCDECHGPSTDPLMSAESIPTCELSQHIERCVNDWVNENAPVGDNGVRTKLRRTLIRVVVSNTKKTVRLKQMNDMYGDVEFPYKERVIFAFQQTDDDHETAFFALRAQEYGKDCPSPNRGHVYLSYIDSIKVYQPTTIRTQVFFRILLAYFGWVKRLGFAHLSLWVCPPRRPNDAYIFPNRIVVPTVSHPACGKLTGLLNWYRRLFDLAEQEGVIVHHGLTVDAIRPTIETVQDVTYFAGDDIPQVIENAIVENVQGVIRIPRLTRRSATPCSSEETPDILAPPRSQDPVTLRMLKALGRNKAKYITVDFVPHEEANTIKNGSTPIKDDPDPVIECEVMNHREAFVWRCEQRDVHFVDPKWVRYSTRQMCLWINEAIKVLPKECQQCRTPCEANKDLCMKCFDASISRAFPKSFLMNMAAFLLPHAASCTSTACAKPLCTNLRQAISHWRDGALRSGRRMCTDGCAVCAGLIPFVLVHSRECNDRECKVPGCKSDTDRSSSLPTKRPIAGSRGSLDVLTAFKKYKPSPRTS